MHGRGGTLLGDNLADGFTNLSGTGLMEIILPQISFGMELCGGVDMGVFFVDIFVSLGDTIQETPAPIGFCLHGGVSMSKESFKTKEFFQMGGAGGFPL